MPVIPFTRGCSFFFTDYKQRKIRLDLHPTPGGRFEWNIYVSDRLVNTRMQDQLSRKNESFEVFLTGSWVMAVADLLINEYEETEKEL